MTSPLFLRNFHSALIMAAALAILPARAVDQAKPDALTADGGKYYGRLVDGKFQSQGRIEWANGARYEGDFDQGLFSGKGSYRDSNGQQYDGHYKDGAFNGMGKLQMIDGAVYAGQFANGAFNGTGTLTFAGGMVYEGGFVNHAFQGAGKYTSATENYTGNFKQGSYDGQGSVTYKNGNSYRGQFVSGMLQGQGRFENANGRVFEGLFNQGNFEGNGILQSKTEGRHVGSFKNWLPEGPGKFTSIEGDTFEGNFVHGALQGAGIYIGKDGERYDGQFKNWKYDGQGVLRAQGNLYRGQFKYGMFHGEGELTYAAPQKDGRTKDVGTWSYGQLQDPQEQQRVAMNVETALYNQKALLDAQLGALLPHQAGKINMYLLAVGGHGHQEVFRRETEYVRAQFDRDFATSGRSAVLINSRTTVDKYPMATKTSIRQALNGVAEKMDKQNDILFLFLTSHGSKDHQLSLRQKGMALQNLPAQDLGLWLRQSGIRWKVIVVSACYSGGFIDPLKDDHTLVITAARSDRTSFGCADDNDFTYFSEAYFQDALPRSASFSDAFNRAKLLVTARETLDLALAQPAARDHPVVTSPPGIGGAAPEEEEEEAEEKTATPAEDSQRYHSEPQIAQGKAIERYLQQWRAQLPMATPAGAAPAGPAPSAAPATGTAE